MSGIEWNQVTWYSRLATIVVFVGLLPVLDFYIGVKYQETNTAIINAAEASAIKPACPITIKTIYVPAATSSSESAAI